MNPNYNREKGKRAERELAELMEKISGVRYRRTPSSGAMHQDFPFDVMKIGQAESVFDRVGNECKNTKRLVIPEWVEQINVAAEDAGLHNAKWFIAFKIKGKFHFLINEELFTHLFTSLDKLHKLS